MAGAAVGQRSRVLHLLFVEDMRVESPVSDHLQRIFTESRCMHSVNQAFEVNGFFILAISWRILSDIPDDLVSEPRVMAAGAAFGVVGTVAAVIDLDPMADIALVDANRLSPRYGNSIGLIDREVTDTKRNWNITDIRCSVGGYRGGPEKSDTWISG